jgi:hypothetical protein
MNSGARFVIIQATGISRKSCWEQVISPMVPGFIPCAGNIAFPEYP